MNKNTTFAKETTKISIMLFKKKAQKTQVELAVEQLEKGKVLDMMTMLFLLGIANHTGVIAKVRKRYEALGKGYDYVKTDMREVRARKSGMIVRVAYYYIPEFVKDKRYKK